MPARSIPHSLLIILSVLLILTLFAAIWVNPRVELTLGLIFLLFMLAATSYMIDRKNREAYRQGKFPIPSPSEIFLVQSLAKVVSRALLVLTGNLRKAVF